MTNVNAINGTIEDDKEEFFEEWSHEQLRKRSQELQLIDINGKYTLPVVDTSCRGPETIDRNYLTTDDGLIGDFDDVSASTTSDSQVCVYVFVNNYNRKETYRFNTLLWFEKGHK